MTARFIVRLLDADARLLAWAEVLADAKLQPRGGSCPFFAPGPTRFLIERDGMASRLTVHWADLDVAREVPNAVLEPLPVTAGQQVNYGWLEPVWLVQGWRDVPLPQVTVRAPVVLNVPTGTIAAKDSRL